MVTASLRKRQFTVETAREGRQALERVKANPPDVIISDVMMPVMDGWTFVKQLRQDPRLAVIPVIFLTALGKDHAKLRSLGLSEEDYLAKPFRFEELERRVDAALANRPTPAAPEPPAAGPTPSSGLHPTPNYPPGPAAGTPGYPPANHGHGSGLHPIPGYPPPGPTPASGAHPVPGYPPPPNHASGAHPLPQNPYYPPGQYPAQPGQYPPQPGQYPPQYGPAPGQYPPPQPGQYPPQPGQYPPQYAPPPGQYPGPPPQAQSADDANHPGQRPRRSTALHGKLEQLGLSSLLVMMEMERKQGVLSLMPMTGRTVGRVFLRGGQVVAAKLDDEPDLPERECVYRMLAWQSGTFSFSATTVDVEDTVQSSTTHLLMEGARLIDEAGRNDEGL